MLRFMFPLLIEVNIFCRPFAFLMALISIYHASFIALRQVDFKKIIAYSSISHMGFVILGLFSMNLYGLLGSLFIMFSHGIVASTLFFLVGILYDRYKVRNILYYGGLTNVMPIFVVVFFFILANLSFPGTSNFVGELIVLFGLIEINFFTTILSTFSIIFTAIYSIWFFNRISFGPLNPSLSGFSDLNKIEFLVCLIFFIFLIAFGFKPDLILSNVEIELFKFLIKVN